MLKHKSTIRDDTFSALILNIDLVIDSSYGLSVNMFENIMYGEY